MAQDFGDEMGDSLRRALVRGMGYYIRDWLREREYQRRLNEHDGNRDAGDANAPVTGQEQPEEVYMPFGEAGEAERFAGLCRDEGVDVAALTDADGRGFIRFNTADFERVQECAPQFAEQMTKLQLERISKALEGEPVNPAKIEGLTEIKAKTAAPEQVAASPALSAEADAAKVAGQSIGHTRNIANMVRYARERCTTYEDFKEILEAERIGTTVTKDGENLFYEARLDEKGNLLPYSREMRDWSVRADTLRNDYGVDATNKWFEENTPKDGGPGGPRSVKELPVEPQVADGSLDMDGRTPDINQGIESHDGMDTDTRTLRLEREQNGTDVAPSEVHREAVRAREDDLSLDSVAKECRAASKQLEHESGIAERELDISDKMNPVR